MCSFKSAIILKDSVFVPDYDSHTDMLEELKIEDTKKNAERLFVRAELLPPDDDVFAPLENWKFSVDQDILPDWFVSEVDGERMRKAVAEWAEKHIFVGKKDLTFSEGTYLIKDCTVGAYGDSTVRACNNSTVRAYGNSTVRAYGNSTVIACGNSRVIAYDNSTVRACDNSRVEACGDSTVEACGNSTVRAYGNSTVRAYDNSTVIAYGNSTVIAYDNSTVRAYGNSTVIIPKWSSNTDKKIITNDNAILINHKNKTITHCREWEVNKVGGDTKCTPS